MTAAPEPSGRMLLVCCFLDEERHLPTFLASIAAQDRPPDKLLLVDDGSSDASPRLAEGFAARHPFAELLRRPRRPAARDRLADAPELRAFHWALARVGEPYELVAKIDADLELTPRTLAHLERCLDEQPQLGLVGPYLSEIAPDGCRRRDDAPPQHVRGALKLYRRACLEQVEPIPEILGWDTIDEIAARMHGWRTRSEPIPDGDPLHLRPTGAHDGSLRAYRRWGACAWGWGAHPLHVLLAAASRARRPPRVVGALSYLAGWAQASARRAPRASADVRAFGRGEQLARIRREVGVGRRRRGAPGCSAVT